MSTDPDRARILDELVADAAEQGGERREAKRRLLEATTALINYTGAHDDLRKHVGALCAVADLLERGAFGADAVAQALLGRPVAPGPDRALELLRELVAAYGTSPFPSDAWNKTMAEAMRLVEDAKHEH